MKNIKKILTVVLSVALVVCMFSALSATAFAAVSQSVDATITVKQQFTIKNGNKPSAGDTFNYRLTPENDETPMPSGSQDGVFDFSLTGKEDSLDIVIGYTHAGVYKYRIEHVLEKSVKGYIYDNTVYDVEVHVTNIEGDELQAVVICSNKEGEKPDEIIYKHSFYIPVPVKTGDDSNLTLMGTLCVLSMMVCAGAFVLLRKKEN